MKIQNIIWIFLVLGFVGVIISSTPSSLSASLQGRMDPYDTKGRIFGFAGDAQYTLDVFNDSLISIYILNLEDSMELIRTHEIGNLTPVVALENISDQEGVFQLTMPGLYSLVAMNPTNMTVTFELFLYRIYPQIGMFIPSSMLVAIGVVGIVIVKILPVAMKRVNSN